MVHALSVLGVLLLWAALHPFTTYPLSLWILSRVRARPLQSGPPEGPEPGLSILMCAYNEEAVIEAKIVNLLALKSVYQNLEILVYVDASSDRTAEILRRYEGSIRLIVSSERTGKTPGMNLLMSLVTQPIVMFTDANVMIDLQAPRHLMRYFADPTVGCVAGHLRYTNPDETVTANSGSRYWRMEESIKRLESTVGSCIGADGSLFAIRRELHRPPPPAVCDDLHVSLHVLCQGYRVIQAPDVCAYEASVTSAAEEFSRKARIACQSFSVHRLLWPALRRREGLLVYQYVSHKWLRWLVVYWLAGALLCAELCLLVQGYGLWAAASLASGSLMLAVGYFGWIKPLAQVWDVLTAFAGTGLGVLQSLRGRSYRTWTPAASIRK
jgi:cellulose synthase/poly-beta-1,6-N-acetylglucosamine synthase-like glycosyltransferase